MAASDVNDEEILKMINCCLDVLNLSLDELVEAFGDYWVNVYSQRLYWFYYKKSKNAKEFLLNVDKIHVDSTKNIPNSRPPRFHYQWKDGYSLVMHYQSPRNLIDLAVNLVKAVGKYYKEDLLVKKLSKDKIKVKFNK